MHKCASVFLSSLHEVGHAVVATGRCDFRLRSLIIVQTVDT